MIRELISLAAQGMSKKKRRSFLLFLVLILSFSAVIVSIASVGSISSTNTEYKLDVYGRWTLAITSGVAEDKQWLEQQSWAKQIGSSQYYGMVNAANQSFGFGTIDQNLINMCPLDLDQIQDKSGQWVNSSWPKNSREIVLEAKVLSALGYEAVKGTEIQLTISVPYETVDESGKMVITYIDVQKDFVLCGLIDEYTGLWMLDVNPYNIPLIGIAVTENAAEEVLDSVRQELGNSINAINAIPQYFVYADKADRDLSYDETRVWMQESRKDFSAMPSKNLIVYQSSSKADPNEYYTYAIALVAMITVLCSYIIQLPSEVQSFSILRSIGISRMQMGFVMITEALILCVPAILLGTICGAGLTWLILRFQIYNGSVPIHVSIPYNALQTVILLWLVMVVVSRLVVFLLVVHSPLTGKMQMQSSKYRHMAKLRNGLIVLLVSLLGAVVIFTEMESLSPKERIRLSQGYPSYTVIHPWIFDGQPPSMKARPLTEDDIAMMANVPGVEDIYGVNVGLEMIVYVEGIEDIPMTLYTLSSGNFEDTLYFGKNVEPFENGDYVIMCFPDAESTPKSTRGYQIPKDNITILGYDNFGNLVFESDPTPVSVQWIPKNINSRGINFFEPYILVCSERYLKNLLEELTPEETWGIYTGGEQFGYSEIHITANSNAEELATDNALAIIGKKMNTSIINDRERVEEIIQLATQELLLLYTAEVCIVVVLLFILGSALILETEQETRYFAIMRCIGMSSQQMSLRIIAKASNRGIAAMVAGWLLYSGYLFIRSFQSQDATKTFIAHFETLQLIGLDWTLVLLISGFCLIIPVIVSLIAKRKLMKGVKVI